MPILIAVLLLAPAAPALGHQEGAAIGPDDLWNHWSLEPWVLLSLAAGTGIYLLGLFRLWKQAGWCRGISVRRAACYLGGQGLLAAALLSPLDPLGGTLLSAHMVQHVILIAPAPILLIAGQPGAALTFALPRPWRQGLSRRGWNGALLRVLGWTVRPLPAALLHGVALWIWHAPAAFGAALESTALHAAEHVAFFLSALLFWQSLIYAARSGPTALAGIGAVFLTMLHGGILSALFTFAPRTLYGWYIGRAESWQLDPLADQQLAGLIMGVPMTAIYLLTGVALAERLLRPVAPYSGDKVQHDGGTTLVLSQR